MSLLAKRRPDLRRPFDTLGREDEKLQWFFFFQMPVSQGGEKGEWVQVLMLKKGSLLENHPRCYKHSDVHSVQYFYRPGTNGCFHTCSDLLIYHGSRYEVTACICGVTITRALEPLALTSTVPNRSPFAHLWHS